MHAEPEADGSGQAAPRHGAPVREPTRRATVAGFGLLALLGGLGSLVLTPPLATPDESKHLVRAFLLAEGRLQVPGQAGSARAEVPASFLALEQALALAPPTRPPRRLPPGTLRAERERPLEPDLRVPVSFAGTYGPLAYLPQALGVGLARAAGAGPLRLVQAGRLANLLVYAAVVALALALTPRRPLALALLALLPMQVHLAASLSADAPTLALALLLFALLARYGLEPTAGNATLAAAAGVALLLGLAKPGYAPLALLGLVFVRPGPGLARRALAAGAIGAVAFAATAGWAAFAARAEPGAASPLSDPAGQLALLRMSPLRFPEAVGRSLVLGLPLLLASFVGILGWLAVPLPGWLVAAGCAAPPLAALGDRPDPPLLTPARRLALVGLAALGMLGIYLAAYVGWNRPGAAVVDGVQGRYLAPFVPLLLLAIPSRGAAGRPWLRLAAFAAFAALALAVALLRLAEAFWQAG